MKSFTKSDLFSFVDRADTFEKVSIALSFLKKLAYSDSKSYEDLANALSYKMMELHYQSRYEYKEYSSSCPWNAPGMRVNDFI